MHDDDLVCKELKDMSARLTSLAKRMEKTTYSPEGIIPDFAPDDTIDIDMCADLFKALSNNERLKILRALGSDSSYFAQLLELTGLDNSPLRFHLTVLRDVNLITQERFRGKYMITRLGRQALAMASYFYKNMQKQEMHEHE